MSSMCVARYKIVFQEVIAKTKRKGCELRIDGDGGEYD